MDALKSKLLAKNRRVAKKMDVDGAPVDLIKPTVGDRLRAIEEAEIAGEIDSEGQPKPGRAGAMFAARLMIVLMYRDGHPIFSKDQQAELLEAPWFEDVAPEIQKILSPESEELRKNS